MDNQNILLGILVLALGSYSLRLAGPYLRQQLTRFPNIEVLSNELGQILLFSLAIATALFEANEFAGFARLMGFIVAAILAYKRVPLLIVILLAASTTALLRLLGVS
ncbi:hypothetical protein OA92_05305 [Marinomonas sp. SBI22]|uniref:AzlD domain-containing protein n=1 Tax=unclassified Marinomonas TaxID=196814 RepID=UPI0007AFB082|nr:MULTISPECIES: AzlD domain-containing protein [unclassified Marinomonas]KZM44121.1 hypothetical protein OA92_05305 [Marinomonas sp. SBI22]KZM45280.1 hypothetical protein OA91_06450 [Marinomonas sp. SBI8L]